MREEVEEGVVPAKPYTRENVEGGWGCDVGRSQITQGWSQGVLSVVGGQLTKVYKRSLRCRVDNGG